MANSPKEKILYMCMAFVIAKMALDRFEIIEVAWRKNKESYSSLVEAKWHAAKKFAHVFGDYICRLGLEWHLLSSGLSLRLIKRRVVGTNTELDTPRRNNSKWNEGA